MKKVLILFVLPLLVYSCSEGEKKTEETTEVVEVEMISSDLKNEHLIGPVKSFEQVPYTPAEDGSIGEMDSCCVETENYNEDGFMVSYIEKNQAGEILVEGVMNRTESGKFMSYVKTEDGKETFKRIVNRDEDGNTLNAVDSDSTLQVYQYHTPEKMNENEQPVRGKTFSADSTYIGTWSWQYIDGARVGRSWTDSTGTELYKRVGEVNDKGWVSRVVETSVNDQDETETVVETYTYDAFDDMGNWTQRTTYKDDKPAEVMKRTYAYYESE